jgi:hypothetical protein
MHVNKIFHLKWFIAIIFTSLLIAIIEVQPVLAISPFVGASDGAGLMTVSPTSTTYGSGTGPYTFTFTAAGDLTTGDAIDLVIPAGWTQPSGHTSVVNISCSQDPSGGLGFSGQTIFVDITSCLDGQKFKIVYNNVTTGHISGSPFTFLTETDISGGGGPTPLYSGSPSITVNTKNLTVNSSGLTPANKMYDGTTNATLTVGTPGLVGVVTGDAVTLNTTGAAGTFVNKYVGTGKTVNISGLTLGGADAGNYTLSQPVRSANITTRPLTITAVTNTKTYDGTTVSASVPTLTSGVLQGSDTAAWTQTYDNKNAGSAKVLTPSGKVNDGNNGNDYAYTYITNLTGRVIQSAITITATASAKTYDGTTVSAGVPTLTSGALQGSDTVAWTQTYDNKNAGSAKVLTPAGKVNDGNGGNNYAYHYAAASTGIINPKALTVSATGLTPASKVYDGTTNDTLTIGTPTLIGVISPDSITLITTGAAAAFANRNAGSGKLVYISGLTLGGTGKGNYTLTQPTRLASVSTRPITVTAVTDTKTYDGTTTSSGTPTLTSGTIASVDSAPIWTQSFNTRNAGTGKILIPVGKVNDGNGGNNYAYTLVTKNTGVINPVALTITAVTDTKTYDGTTSSSGVPNLTSGLLQGLDSVSWTQTFNNKNAGSGKVLTPAGKVNDGNSGNNYTYAYVTVSSATINQLAVTVTPQSATKTYDGTTSSSVSPSITPGLAVGDTSAFIETFDTPTAGTNKTLTASGQVNDGNSGNNYAVTFGTPITTGVINTATPTLSVTNSPAAYNGLPNTATVVASVPGSVSNIKYNGSATVPTNAGTYIITADFIPADSTDYNSLTGASAGKFVITEERIINGGFNTYVGTSKIPQSWIAANFAPTEGKDTAHKYEGAASVKITGPAATSKTLMQTIIFSGSSGDKFTFSFRESGSGVPATGLCQAQVKLYNNSTVVTSMAIHCATGSYNFQKKSLVFNATGSYNKVVITFIYNETSGTIWFDLASLIE